jgi:hypothetical protein
MRRGNEEGEGMQLSWLSTQCKVMMKKYVQGLVEIKKDF